MSPDPSSPAGVQVPLELVCQNLTQKLAMVQYTLAVLESANDVLQQENTHLRSLLPGNIEPLAPPVHAHANGDADHAHP